MAIVPIYRLRGTPADGLRRYRFSREPTPDPNPHPGERDEDVGTEWIVEGVAFYAWNDQRDGGDIRPELRPVYEFHRCGGGRHQYYYSLDPEAQGHWKKRPYVAFWAHEEDVEVGAPAIFQFSQNGVKEGNYALSVDQEIEGWTRGSRPIFYASERIPIQVSVRPHWNDPKEYDWTFEPSTVNLAYGSILEFVPAQYSDFSFTNFEVVGGEKDFETPEVTPERVQLTARCRNRGQDYKYNVTVRMGSTMQEISGDPEIVNQRPTAL
jgi:hypothetical protein